MRDTASPDLLYCKLECQELEFGLVLAYMDVRDQTRNENIRRELINIINNCAESEKLLIMGDFNGHLGSIGDQELNRNGRFVLELIIIINGGITAGDAVEHSGRRWAHMY